MLVTVDLRILGVSFSVKKDQTYRFMADLYKSGGVGQMRHGENDATVVQEYFNFDSRVEEVINIA